VRTPSLQFLRGGRSNDAVGPKLLKLKVEPVDFPWPRFQWAEAITHFARAIGAARNGDGNRARLEVEKLAEVQRQLVGGKTTTTGRHRSRFNAELPRRGWQRLKARILRRYDSCARPPISRTRLTNIRSHLARFLPARELLGDMLLELGHPAEALMEYETSLQTSPNRFGGLYGAGRAAEFLKDRKKARVFYVKLTTVCEKAESDRPELVHARKFLAGK